MEVKPKSDLVIINTARNKKSSSGQNNYVRSTEFEILANEKLQANNECKSSSERFFGYFFAGTKK